MGTGSDKIFTESRVESKFDFQHGSWIMLGFPRLETKDGAGQLDLP